MTEETHTIAYPRRVVPRTLLRWIGRALLPLLTRTAITGRENWPKQGPLLVVGNHIAAMETVLMVTYSPWPLEMLGPGDIPPPPAMDVIARFYGYTPINRGNWDRVALRKMLDVLEQGGVVGMFPEGGIWDTGEKPAKRGVAWLSYRAQAPILPIGFGGLEGALTDVLHLKRPPLTMHIGEIIPPVIIAPGVLRRIALQQAADHVLRTINSLVPERFKAQQSDVVDERFEMHIALTDADNNPVPAENRLQNLKHTTALAKLFYRPALLKIFTQDLHLPAEALLRRERDPQQLADALQPILHYVDVTNPAFFTYRFGNEEGTAMTRSLRELHALALWAAEHHYAIALAPVRRYRFAEQSEEIVEREPPAAHKW